MNSVASMTIQKQMNSTVGAGLKKGRILLPSFLTLGVFMG